MTSQQAREFDWRKLDTRKIVTFSVPGAREGGLGLYAVELLRQHGIPARRNTAGSPYQGHVAIEVPMRFERSATRLVL